MKKLYYILTWTFITLLAACSQEEMVNKETEDSRVCISAELPADITATRAQIVVPVDYKLRCIIEVWAKSTSPTLKYRQEVAVDGGELPTFDFGLRPGDYNCLMWVDFIKKDAATSEITFEDVTYIHFEDTFYDTSDLHTVSIKEDATDNLFDTDLCDGFYAALEIKKNATVVRQTMKMKRPFAKLVVKENDADKFTSLNGMTVECQLPKTFSVATGEPTMEMVTAVYDKAFQPGGNTQILFTGYVFVPSSGLSMGSFILSFDADAGKSRCEIPAESINLERNQQLVAAGKLIEGGIVEPEPEPEPSGDPTVGDYFFIDGTWSSELTDENKDDCVGIVYAVGEQLGDDISNYPNSTGKSIKGYVMALKNAEVKNFLPTENDKNYANDGRPYFYRQNESNYDADVVNASKGAFKKLATGWETYNGFSLTEAILANEVYIQNKTEFYHPALAYFEEWKKTAVKVANASEWYIPSAAQLLQFSGGLFGFQGGTAGTVTVPAITKNQTYYDAFLIAIEQGITKHFPTNNGNKGYFVYSISLSTDPAPYALQLGYGLEGAGSILTAKPSYKIQGLIRPVLTIIK